MPEVMAAKRRNQDWFTVLLISQLHFFLIIGNVTRIGKDALRGCKKLKILVIKSEKLKYENIKGKVFKQVKNTNKTLIQVPEKKYVTYKKLLRKKGIGKKVKIAKNMN